MASGTVKDGTVKGGSVRCEVWWARPEAARPELLDLLDAEERTRHARFRRSQDRDRYLVGHALARLACAEAAGCAPAEVEFTRHCPHCAEAEPHGKPRPGGAARGVEMSLTHSGQRVALAVTRGVPVGVDVEQVRERTAEDLAGLAAYVLGETELAQWRALPEAMRTPGFHTYWARKEALLKATGAGIGGGLSAIAVSPADAPAAVVNWAAPDPPEQVWLADLDAGPGHRAAVAVLSGPPVHCVHRDGHRLLDAAHVG